MIARKPSCPPSAGHSSPTPARDPANVLATALSDQLESLPLPLFLPAHEPTARVPPAVPRKPVTRDLWYATRLWDAKACPYMAVVPNAMLELETLAESLLDELDKHPPWAELEPRSVQRYPAGVSVPIDNERFLVTELYAALVESGVWYIMRCLWPDRELFIKTEQRVDHEHGESFIDLAVIWVEQCVNGPETRIGATVEIKVESTFSDTALDALDKAYVHGVQAAVHVGSPDTIADQPAQVRAASGSCSLQFVVKLLGHNNILTRNETACVERIVLCILQSAGYAQVSSTRYGMFSNCNRHLVAQVEQGTLLSAQVFFSHSFGFRSDGTQVVAPGRRFGFPVYLLAIARHNFDRSGPSSEPNSSPPVTSAAISTPSGNSSPARQRPSADLEDAVQSLALGTPTATPPRRTHVRPNYFESPQSKPSPYDETFYLDPSPSNPRQS